MWCATASRMFGTPCRLHFQPPLPLVRNSQATTSALAGDARQHQRPQTDRSGFPLYRFLFQPYSFSMKSLHGIATLLLVAAATMAAVAADEPAAGGGSQTAPQSGHRSDFAGTHAAPTQADEIPSNRRGRSRIGRGVRRPRRQGRPQGRRRHHRTRRQEGAGHSIPAQQCFPAPA